MAISQQMLVGITSPRHRFSLLGKAQQRCNIVNLPNLRDLLESSGVVEPRHFGACVMDSNVIDVPLILSHATFNPFRAVAAERVTNDVENPRSPVSQQSEALVEPPVGQKRGEKSQPTSASSPAPGDADAEDEDPAVPLFNVAMDLVTRCLWKEQVGCARAGDPPNEGCCDTGPG